MRRALGVALAVGLAFGGGCGEQLVELPVLDGALPPARDGRPGDAVDTGSPSDAAADAAPPSDGAADGGSGDAADGGSPGDGAADAGSPGDGAALDAAAAG